MLRYLAPFKVGMTVVFGFVLLYTILGLIGPYLMGQAIDRFISTKQVAGLATISLWMLAVYLLNNMGQVVANWVMANISQRALKVNAHGPVQPFTSPANQLL